MNGKDFVYWAEDPNFSIVEHHLIMEKISLDLYSGSCSCGEYLRTGDNYAIMEDFDAHAERIQRLSLVEEK